MKHIATIIALLLLAATTVSAQNDLNALHTLKIEQAIGYIDNYYLDTVDIKSMVDKSIAELFQSLDPHSSFIPAADVKSANEELDGSFEGVGIEYAIIADTLTVQNVISGGPSEAVGVASGDKIIMIDTLSIAGNGISAEDVKSRLRGPSGTKVDVVVLRQGETGCDTIDFTIERGKIPINCVEAAYVTEEGSLYVKLGRFSLTTMDELFAAFKLSSVKPKSIIIDLRGNGGGYMTPAVIMSDLFLKKGQLILFTEGAHYPRMDKEAKGISLFKDEPLVVLVDESTASASEIFAGAMQDWDRGLIVGRRTFGKGLVQQSFFLQDYSEIRLTVARYHTPSGRVIQSPYESGKRSEYYRKYYERYLSGELFSRDSIQFPDSLKYTTLVQKRTVYGGGGIMPDYFIPEDTTGINNYYVKLIRKGVLTEYCNLYTDSHRHQLLADSISFDAFCENYEKLHADTLFNGLLEYAAGKGIEPSEGELEAAEPLIRVRLKAMMARTPFNTTGYWRVINKEADPDFKKALELIADWPKIFPSL